MTNQLRQFTEEEMNILDKLKKQCSETNLTCRPGQNHNHKIVLTKSEAKEYVKELNRFRFGVTKLKYIGQDLFYRGLKITIKL